MRSPVPGSTGRLAAPDIGSTTRAALTSGQRSAADLARHARSRFESGASGAGNGSLMRTTPVVLGYLHDPEGLTAAARIYSDITHGDPDAADACVLWNHAQRHAILHGDLDLTVGLTHVPPERRDLWAERINAAQAGRPGDFTNNGWVVGALQCAWSAITTTAVDGPEHFEQAVRQAVAAGHDTDTVAAIAGSLLGAHWGVSAIPIDWRRRIHGWPGLTGQDLVRLTSAALTGHEWPQRLYGDLSPASPPVALRSDPGVWIGDVFGLADLPDEVTAVVSLCRLGAAQAPPRIEFDKHAEVWLIDSASPAQNPHLDFVARDTVDLIARLRGQGETVYVHCVQAHSRTPFIAAMYVARVAGKTALQALAEVDSLLPDAHPNAAFMSVLSRS